MEKSARYQFNFTAGSAMVQESITVAESYMDCGEDWEKAIQHEGLFHLSRHRRQYVTM